MQPNTLEVTFKSLILHLPNAADWLTAKRITGKVKEITPGTYEMALSTHNMQRILRFFDGERKPIVIRGREHLDKLSEKLNHYKHAKANLQQVLNKERYPVESNGKFVPYAHQTKIIGTLLNHSYPAIFADCGTGKTGSTGRAIEILMKQGVVRRGKVLVSAPLSILRASWGDDLNKFTDLRWSVLWTPKGNKISLGEERVNLGSFGEKPSDSVAVKTKKGVRFQNKHTKQLKEIINALDGPKSDWTKYQASWKVSITLDGSEHPFGEVSGRVATKEMTRENYLREQLARTDVDVFLINHDGVKFYEDILKQHDFEWIIVDESTKIKSYKSQVSQAHTAISWNCKRRTILTGTPNPNGFEDLWHQFYFLDRGLTLEPSYRDFMTEYFDEIPVYTAHTPAGNKTIVKYMLKTKNEEDKKLLERVRSNGIFLEQRDCLDLPPRTDMLRTVYMLPEQEEAYVQMATSLIATLEDQPTGKSVESEAVNTLSKLLRLRQITSGFLSNREGELVALTTNPKYTDLDDLIDELGGKKIVLVCQFREEIRQLLSRYKDRGACAIYGDVSEKDRTEAIYRFQSDPLTQVIILHPAAAAHGITLTAASYMIFLSMSYNFEHYYQTAKRIERIGQHSPIFILHSLARFADDGETIDEVLLDVMRDKAQNRTKLFKDSPQELAQQIISRIRTQIKGRR